MSSFRECTTHNKSNYVPMCMYAVRVTALSVALVGFIVITFLIIFVGRCVAAGLDYLGTTDWEDSSVEDVLTSDEFLDFGEASYWGWGALAALVVWGSLVLFFAAVCAFRWSLSVLFIWFCCDPNCWCCWMRDAQSNNNRRKSNTKNQRRPQYFDDDDSDIPPLSAKHMALYAGISQFLSGQHRDPEGEIPVV